jgi:beta-1,4-mannosyl-glycoprotein beta-1,4-N-acetylglucosaminyltransferase
MPNIYDCFLYNHERELLSIRLKLLGPVVDRFVVAWSNETFTGLKKQEPFPYDLVRDSGFGAKTKVIEIEALRGKGPWERETFSRNALGEAIDDAGPQDVVMVSDVDEIPRPSVLGELSTRARHQKHLVLEQEYFNFRFNYRLVHGLDAIWPGTVACQWTTFQSAQALRDERWNLLSQEETRIQDAGWHFSFLTTRDVSRKLASFSHQERAIQSRRESVEALINLRHGFYDHIHAGSVWAVANVESLRCPELERLVREYREFLVEAPPDNQQTLDDAIRHRVRLMRDQEREKMIAWYGWRELVIALWRRLGRRIFRAAGQS